MDFDQPIDRRKTHSGKWNALDRQFGIPMEDGLAMWTADSDYPTAPCVTAALRREAGVGIFGYIPEYAEYKNAVAWWMNNRHGWEIDPDWILTAQGLGNAIALSLHTYSEPGDHVAIFSPVYHEFALKIARTNRVVTECPLARVGDDYELDLDAAQSRLTGKETVLIWCSPQNPTGRVWTAAELRSVSEFAARNGMILLCDEIHHDLVYAGNNFVPMDVAAPEGRGHTVYLTSASKTFNIAGMRTGQMTIPDDNLREKMQQTRKGLDYKPASLGMIMTEAAYSPEGAKWVDAQIDHLENNRKRFDAGINQIPGVRSLPLQSTYLAWVDFADTGMTMDEIQARFRDDAKIAASPGPSFGTGGETFMRINLATQGAIIDEAVVRLQSAFSDLQ